MTQRRHDYPLFRLGYQQSAGDVPVMLDGMEVVFDRTVGLYPVQLEPTSGPAQPGGNGTPIVR